MRLPEAGRRADSPALTMPLTVFEYIPEYRVEPELLRPVPRRLRFATWPMLIVCGCVGVFAMLMACAAFIGARSVELLWLSHAGKQSVARIADCDYGDGVTGPCSVTSLREPLRIDYRFGGKRRLTGSAPVSLIERPQVVSESVGMPAESSEDLGEPIMPAALPQAIPRFVHIRYADLVGVVISSPVRALSVRSLLIGLTASLLIAAIVAAAGTRFARWLRRTLSLLRCGEVAIATVLAKEIRESDLPRYYVTYGFSDADGAAHERSERCTPEQWRRLEIGQEATVLYPGPQPSRAELYEHLPVRCA